MPHRILRSQPILPSAGYLSRLHRLVAAGPYFAKTHPKPGQVLAAELTAAVVALVKKQNLIASINMQFLSILSAALATTQSDPRYCAEKIKNSHASW